MIMKEYKIWSRFEGLVLSDVNILNGEVPTDNPKLLTTLLNCFRTGESLLINGELKSLNNISKINL